MGGVDLDFVERFAYGPPESTIQRAVSLHQNLRAMLPEEHFLTFLQGSYRNGTALADINDVDVVVVYRGVERSGWFPDYSWAQIFDVLRQRLNADSRYAGKITLRDKCLNIGTGINLDVVPAIHDGTPGSDPIWIYSRSQETERRNWPRQHHERCTAKNTRTRGAFKRTVRLLKRWSRCHFGASRVAPSYYVECLLYSLPDKAFEEDSLARSFCLVANAVDSAYRDKWWPVLPRVGGEGDDLLGSKEWSIEAFVAFQQALYASREHAMVALTEESPQRAKAAWRRAFNGFDY